jgi:hypothetical protein
VPAEPVHLAIAPRVADALALAAALRPAFALGSVAPDVNNLLGWPRPETHFWYGPAGGDVSGALTLLARHPELAARGLSPPERAFLAGYLGHLVTDEQELTGLYRPYVDRAPADGPPVDGRELRLAALIVVDARVAALDPSRLHAGVAALREARHLRLRGDLLPFAPMAAVRAWADRTLAVVDLPPSRPRVEPHLARNEPPAETTRRVAALQERVERALPPPAIRGFVGRSVEQSVALLSAYLAGRALPIPWGTAPPRTAPHRAHRRPEPPIPTRSGPQEPLSGP